MDLITDLIEAIFRRTSRLLLRGTDAPRRRHRRDRARAATSGWVSVRCVFRTTGGGRPQHYEERITLWHTADVEAAIALAETDAADYATDLSTPPASTTEYTGLAQACSLTDPPVHGGEVFSLIRTSDLAPREYLDAHFDTGRERQEHLDGDEPAPRGSRR